MGITSDFPVKFTIYREYKLYKYDTYIVHLTCSKRVKYNEFILLVSYMYPK